MDERKLKLISALEQEKDRLKMRGMDTEDHSITIRYLKTGVHGLGREEIQDYDLLDACVNDYETLLSDYGV